MVLFCGRRSASVSYVTSKAKGSQEIGMFEETIRLPADVAEDEVLKVIDNLNRSQIYRYPCPASATEDISVEKVINYISPEKDVDGFHP